MTTSPTAASAVKRVFETVELLETVLVQLSSKDLLLSQRTASCFRATVQGSITLRRKLFLEPDLKLEGRLFNSHETSHGSVKRPGCKPENNLLLLGAFPGCYPTITLVAVSDSTGVRAGHDTSGPDADSDEGKRRIEHWSWDVCISFPADDKPSVTEAVEYPEASWRQMYLCQPPCADLYLVRRWQKGLKPAIIRDGGIKMGDFIEEATKPIPECDGRTWHSSYISCVRKWHFEGNIKCGSVEV